MNIATRYKAAANRTSAEKLATPLGASDTLPLSVIRTDGGTQSRVELDQGVVADYAAALADGAFFPSVTVFKDGNDYLLADGFHRHAAHVAAGQKKIAVHVLVGDRRDAILYSVGANQTHGLRRTNADKHRAVSMLLGDPEWSIWSDREIARKCAVGADMVGRLRPADTVVQRQYVHPKTGQPTTMNTAAIGKSVPDAIDIDLGNLPTSDEQNSNCRAGATIADPVDHTAFHEGAREGLPHSIKDLEAAKQQAIADRGAPLRHGLASDDRIAELEEHIRVLEAENEALKAENKTYGEMKVQFEQGGFDKVVVDKDEVIRVLETRVYRESEDKVGWMKSSVFWKEKAIELGWSKDAFIPLGEPDGGAGV